MKKYTIEEIKKTNVYKSNIEAVKAIYPRRGEDFAYELMVAANSAGTNNSSCSLNDACLCFAFFWEDTYQGYGSWNVLCDEIYKYNNSVSK